MTGAMISDSELRTLFDATDEDGSGDVSIEELTSFVWGEPEKAAAPEPEQAKEPEPKPAEPEVQVRLAVHVPAESAAQEPPLASFGSDPRVPVRWNERRRRWSRRSG